MSRKLKLEKCQKALLVPAKYCYVLLLFLIDVNINLIFVGDVTWSLNSVVVRVCYFMMSYVYKTFLLFPCKFRLFPIF